MKREQEMDDSRLRRADREMYCSWTAGVGGTWEPPLPQSSLCHHLDAILKPSAPAPHVNKGTTPNMLSSLNELSLAAAEPQNGWLSGVWTGTRMAGWYYWGGHSGLYHSGAGVAIINDVALMFVQKRVHKGWGHTQSGWTKEIKRWFKGIYCSSCLVFKSLSVLPNFLINNN